MNVLRNTTGSIFLLLLGLPAVSLAAEPALTRFHYQEPHMGTLFQITLYAPDQAAADRAAKAAFARIAALNGIMSDYQATSELMRLCARAGGDPVPVSPELFTVLRKAQEVARRSEGAFDVTVGPLSVLWRRARKLHEMPEPADLARARALVGYQKMHLDAAPRTVRLEQPGMRLDLGGIAKGYAADEALAVLRQHGVTRALVAAGGDIAVSGPPPGKEGWTVGIAPLENPNRKPRYYLVLHDAAVSTSGDAEQYVELDGKRYSHIFDPRTGMPLTGRLSATVVAPNGITADSLTKTVAVLGPEKGLPLIDATEGAAAYLVRQTDQGTETFASRRFKDIPHHE